MFYFGAHLKKGNIIDSLEEIRKYGGNFLQIFVSNPMSGRHTKKMLEKLKVDDIRDYLKKHQMGLVIHSPYTLNFARRVVTPQDAYWVKSYYNELLIAHQLGAMGCVIHVGKHLNYTEKEALEYMHISLKYLIHRVINEKLGVYIILETAAGQGTEVLSNVDDLLVFYSRFSEREKNVLKLCFDTAHLFSAGNDITQIGHLLKDVVLIHLNDSKREFNSHVDRHERIGKGHIGKTLLSDVVRMAHKHHIPIILETPDNGYKKEIPWIKQVIVS